MPSLSDPSDHLVPSRLSEVSPFDRILLTTLARSGTHYYAEFFGQLFGLKRRYPDCEIDFSKRRPAPAGDPYAFDRTWRTLRSGEILAGHYPRNVNLARYLDAHPNVLCIHAVRDMRDAVVSSTHYFRSRPEQPLGPFFRNVTFEQALLYNIIGCSVPYELQPPQQRALNPWKLPMMYGVNRMAGENSRVWADRPEVVLLRYEDFFGAGGEEGCDSSYLASKLRKQGVGITVAEVAALCARLTFEAFSGGRRRGQAEPGHHYYKGVAGEWRTLFRRVHSAAARALYGDWLIDFGYERDLQWASDIEADDNATCFEDLFAAEVDDASLQLDPHNLKALLRHTGALADRHDRMLAELHLAQRRNLAYDNELRRLFNADPRREQVQPMLERMIEQVPSDPFWQYHLAICLLNRGGDPGRATRLLEEAGAAGFEPYWVAFHLTCAHALRGDEAATLRELDRAMELMPEGADVEPLVKMVDDYRRAWAAQAAPGASVQ